MAEYGEYKYKICNK